MYWAIWHILAGCSATCDIHFHYLCDVEKGVGKIGLAISGGCARVAAAIGLLKVIERMGIDTIIAIDLQQITFWQAGFSLKERFGIGGLLHWAVSHPEVKRYRQNVKLADIYIKPPLKAIDGYIFSSSRSRRMIEAGEAAARRYCPQLQALTCSYL